MWLIECNETEQATEMVVTLSDFFRLVLSHGQEFISIRMEEQHVRSYLQIQETRYHDIMEYHILIDPELYGYQIPKMTLQPIVENALYHGIKGKKRLKSHANRRIVALDSQTSMNACTCILARNMG